MAWGNLEYRRNYMKDWKWYVLAVLTFAVIIWAYIMGKHSERRITYFSELVSKTQGRTGYLIDMEIVCSNGKDLGRFQVDVNLTNGKLVIVRNDSKREPNCVK